MYSKAFSKVYNEFGWNYFPEAFADQLLSWMEKHRFTPLSCLDIGCGTGVLCEILTAHGITCTGIDLSENMIDIARSRNANIRYEVANMVTYHAEVPIDLVTCTGDAVNHVLDPKDVLRVFQNVYEELTHGGLFIFDILSGKEIGDGTPIDLDYSETVRAQFRIRSEGDLVRLNISVNENGEAFEETVTETIHSPELIRTLLIQAGFSDIQMVETLLDGEINDSTTYYFIARKA